MLTLFHSPNSRSTAIMSLIAEMGLGDELEIRVVEIPRMDGTGRVDPANPHPEGKVPCLQHDDQVITERGAIMAHLATLFPSPLAPQVGTAEWGSFLSWLSWYQGVMEPVLICQAAGIDHPYLMAGLRGPKEMAARLHQALAKGPWLLGRQFSAVDLLCFSPFAWMPEATPEDPLIKDWVARCLARPTRQEVLKAEAQMMARLAA